MTSRSLQPTHTAQLSSIFHVTTFVLLWVVISCVVLAGVSGQRSYIHIYFYLQLHGFPSIIYLDNYTLITFCEIEAGGGNISFLLSDCIMYSIIFYTCNRDRGKENYNEIS